MERVIREYLEPGGGLCRIFPQYEYRPEQLRMALDIAATFQSPDGVLVAEAGTGTGKSMAYLIPAAVMGRTVIISTGTKNLQEQLIHKDIPLLNRILDKPVRAVLVKGRQNYLCRRRWEMFIGQPEFDSVRDKKLFERVRVWAAGTATGDRAEMDFLPDTSGLWRHICSRRDDCLGGRCTHFSACFLLRLRIAAQNADLVIANHHLFFADATLRRGGAVSALPDTEAIIFDEAHLLEEVVTQFLGVHIGYGDIIDFLDMIRRWKPKRRELEGREWGLAGVLGTVEEGAGLFFKQFHSGEGRFELIPRWNDEADRMATVFLERLAHLEKELDGEGLIPEEFRGEWKMMLRDFAGRIRFFQIHDDSGMAWWGEHAPVGNTIHASPIDISAEFPGIIRTPLRPVILSSATLSAGDTFAFFVDRLGINGSMLETYPSPFDYPSQGILYLPDHLPDPNHLDFYDRCAEEIVSLVDISEGRAFILTTSYSGLNSLRTRLQDAIDYPLLVQGDAPKHRLISDFTRDIHSVLLATISFWQGVDVPGEALSAVIIDKLPFASPGDPMTRARIDHLNAHGGNAFIHYQVPAAVMMLKQGVGRLIRSRSDRGLVAVLDHRIVRRQYGRMFLDSLPPFRQTSSLDDLRTFFTGQTGRETRAAHSG
ncbi:ATP-dependent DNA helicase [bacterium]|nr:ATP-dependent DNA helicase [candidate division CSSED10-310 bacterium]